MSLIPLSVDFQIYNARLFFVFESCKNAECALICENKINEPKRRTHFIFQITKFTFWQLLQFGVSLTDCFSRIKGSVLT